MQLIVATLVTSAIDQTSTAWAWAYFDLSNFSANSAGGWLLHMTRQLPRSPCSSPQRERH